MTAAERRDYIGGSDAASIVGLSPWKSRYELWQEKTGAVEPADLSGVERVYWGTVLEEVVATEYAARKGVKVRRVNRLLTHPDHPFMAAHLDRAVTGTQGLLECKTADKAKAYDWGEDGTDQIPDYYLPQVMHYMAVTGAPWCDVAVLIGGNEFRSYHIDRDEDFINALIALEIEFWHMVQTRTEPEARTGLEARQRYRKAREAAAQADMDTYNMALELKQVQRNIAALETLEDDLKGKIQLAMADMDTLEWDGQKIATWKNQDKTSLDGAALKAADPDTWTKYQKTTSSRVFRLAVKDPK